jgi:hypothetical protein
MAFPRSLDRRGFTLKSKMMSLTTRSMRERELSTLCIVPHWRFSSSFCQSFSPSVLASNQASILTHLCHFGCPFRPKTPLFRRCGTGGSSLVKGLAVSIVV